MMKRKSATKRMRAKILSTMLCIGLLAGTIPMTAMAVPNEPPKIRAIHFVDGGSSTVYVNEAKCTGASSESIKYLYSSDLIHTDKIFDNLRSILSTDYANLVPATAVEETVGLTVSTAGTPNAQWVDATWVANNVITDIGTVTETTNSISAASILMDIDSLQSDLEAENYAAWQEQEAENQAAFEAEHAEEPSLVYIPSEYVPLDFNNTTVDELPTLQANQFTTAVGISLIGPFFIQENNITNVYYDIDLVTHIVTVVSETATKAVEGSGINLPV